MVASRLFCAIFERSPSSGIQAYKTANTVLEIIKKNKLFYNKQKKTTKEKNKKGKIPFLYNFDTAGPCNLSTTYGNLTPDQKIAQLNALLASGILIPVNAQPSFTNMGNKSSQASPNIINVPVNTGNNDGNVLTNGNVGQDKNGGDAGSYASVTVISDSWKVWAAQNDTRTVTLIMGLVIAALTVGCAIAYFGWYRAVRAQRSDKNRRRHSSRRRSSRGESIVKYEQDVYPPTVRPPSYTEIEIPRLAPIAVLPRSPSKKPSSPPRSAFAPNDGTSASIYC